MGRTRKSKSSSRCLLIASRPDLVVSIMPLTACAHILAEAGKETLVANCSCKNGAVAPAEWIAGSGKCARYDKARRSKASSRS
ncbi:hypothetical protein KC328_g22 [Hortaea werneckii]|nr:hypothetical protein KC328_g22 [Hortaea werneckii]